ncbi:hypothetical protein PSQ19_00385 [Devosia algicola]|uniref:Uncharacterized protein n=1 Tax=Devosia algicola TaxID=3026418 RepID=A0ABY7YNG7_9HYPH|nr:hypothetical protein [Devosia algicola]WDR02737.1 hypothetical protein PSQ19_00385 [Devosia algicola]
MGKLVKFDQRRSLARKARLTTGDAQILMFTGVRYERGTTPTAMSNPCIGPSKPKPSRKRG